MNRDSAIELFKRKFKEIFPTSGNIRIEKASTFMGTILFRLNVSTLDANELITLSKFLKEHNGNLGTTEYKPHTGAQSLELRLHKAFDWTK